MTVQLRHSSPTLLEGEAKLPKKTHSVAGPSNAKGKADTTREMCCGNMQSNFVVDTGVFFLASENSGFILAFFCRFM